jgi:glycerol-3-phosphate cytidylyltransferase-like family protein
MFGVDLVFWMPQAPPTPGAVVGLTGVFSSFHCGRYWALQSAASVCSDTEIVTRASIASIIETLKGYMVYNFHKNDQRCVAASNASGL